MKKTIWVVVIAALSIICIAWSSRSNRSQVLAARHSPSAEPSGFAGVFTWHNDNARDGLNSQETILTPANVHSGGFGPVFSYPVDGYIWGQPLYVPQVSISGFGLKNVVYVATAHDSVYAFDADGEVNTPLWQTSFLNASQGITTLPATVVSCPNGPEYGVTSTPVIDPVAGILYALATVYIQSSQKAFFTLHALNIATGSEIAGSPVIVSASLNGDELNALQENSRPALLLANGNIYMAFASYCDRQPFNGWALAYNATTLKQIAEFPVAPKGKDGGIWMTGCGMSADSAGNVYATTGNGTFDANEGGPDFGDSILKFNPMLTVIDYFTPYNQALLNLDDFDVSAAGHLLLPDQPGAFPHELVTGNKDGDLYLVNRDNLGHFNPGGDKVVQEIQYAFPNGLWSGFAYWNFNIYVAAVQDHLEQFPLANGILGSPRKGKFTYSYPGATPSISSNGNAAGIIWTASGSLSSIELHAALASNVTKDIYDSGSIGDAPVVKFNPPTIANGRVYLGTQTELLVFGLPAD
jgi:hypothetical protein